MLRRKSGFWISVCLLFTGLHGLIQPQIIHAQLTATNPTTFGFQSDEIPPEVDPLEVEGDIVVAGSETLLPLTERLYDRFIEAGYGGILRFMRVETNAGFLVFCEKGTVDVVIATRRLSLPERLTCLKHNRHIVELRLGTDALVVVVNPDNDLVSKVSLGQLEAIFT